jgi:hypothetical protein
MNTAKSGCEHCRRKTPLKVTCKCTKVLCFGCRYPEEHQCTFDYKKEGEEYLKKINPTILTEKLDKI